MNTLQQQRRHFWIDAWNAWHGGDPQTDDDPMTYADKAEAAFDKRFAPDEVTG